MIPPSFKFWAAKIINKIDAPKGLSGKDTTLHKEAMAGSVGLTNDRSTTAAKITRNNRPTKVPFG